MGATAIPSDPQPLSALPVGALQVQPHGGALRNGGTNKSGKGGPPPERIRRLFRQGLKRSAPDLNRIAAGEMLQLRFECAKCGCTPDDGDTPWLDGVLRAVAKQVGERLRAIETQLKYGVGLPGSLTMDAIDGYNGALWAAVTDWATSHAIDDATLEPLRDGLQQVARSFAKQHKR